MKEDTDKTWIEVHGGFARDMTMRDEFAGRAMQGLITNADYDWIQGEEISKIAYSMADAMLKARDAE